MTTFAQKQKSPASFTRPAFSLSRPSLLSPVERTPFGPSRPLVQTKLTMNEPGDKHEQQADRTVAEVMRSTAGPWQASVPAGVQTVGCNNGHTLSETADASPTHRMTHNFGKISMFPPPPQVQAKLTVNQPGDKYEQEADRIADLVMRMPDSAVQDVSPRSETVQRKCAACESGGKPCPKCAEEDEKIQRKLLASQITPLAQRRENSAAAPEVTPQVASQINSLRGGGQPLPEATRRFFEPRFGADFSDVWVHTGSQADQTARHINARAFTVGQNVVFGEGQYKPQTFDGQMLLAHELTHTMQQRSKNLLPSEVLQRTPLSWLPLNSRDRKHLIKNERVYGGDKPGQFDGFTKEEAVVLAKSLKECAFVVKQHSDQTYHVIGSEGTSCHDPINMIVSIINSLDPFSFESFSFEPEGELELVGTVQIPLSECQGKVLKYADNRHDRCLDFRKYRYSEFNNKYVDFQVKSFYVKLRDGTNGLNLNPSRMESLVLDYFHGHKIEIPINLIEVAYVSALSDKPEAVELNFITPETNDNPQVDSFLEEKGIIYPIKSGRFNFRLFSTPNIVKWVSRAHKILTEEGFKIQLMETIAAFSNIAAMGGAAANLKSGDLEFQGTLKGGRKASKKTSLKTPRRSLTARGSTSREISQSEITTMRNIVNQLEQSMPEGIPRRQSTVAVGLAEIDGKRVFVFSVNRNKFSGRRVPQQINEEGERLGALRVDAEPRTRTRNKAEANKASRPEDAEQLLIEGCEANNIELIAVLPSRPACLACASIAAQEGVIIIE